MSRVSDGTIGMSESSAAATAMSRYTHGDVRVAVSSSSARSILIHARHKTAGPVRGRAHGQCGRTATAIAENRNPRLRPNPWEAATGVATIDSCPGRARCPPAFLPKYGCSPRGGRGPYSPSRGAVCCVCRCSWPPCVRPPHVWPRRCGAGNSLGILAGSDSSLSTSRPNVGSCSATAWSQHSPSFPPRTSSADSSS